MNSNLTPPKVMKPVKKRPIVVRYYLTEDDKKQLRKVARELGYKGLRELLEYRGTTDLGDQA